MSGDPRRIKNVTKQSDCITNMISNCIEVTEEKGADPVTLERGKVHKTKGKETIHKHCILVYEMMSYWGYRLIIWYWNICVMKLKIK